MRNLLIAGALTLALTGGAAKAAEFDVHYNVQGTQAGGNKQYSGTVTITPTGSATYQVVWVIAGQKFVGTGIGKPEGLAVAYKSGSQTGIAIYHQNDDGEVEGVWTYAGGTEVYSENWTPADPRAR